MPKPRIGATITDEALTSVKFGGYEPRCKACNYPGHEEHDKALLAGRISDSDYARLVGCKPPSIARHRSHISEEIAQSAQAQAVLRADELFKSIQDEASIVRELRDKARAEGNIELALKAVDRALKCIEIYAKVQGLIQEGAQVNVLINNPEWISLRTKIVLALDHYPEAKAAVVRALEE